MARIRQIMNERRLAYEAAFKLQRERALKDRDGASASATDATGTTTDVVEGATGVLEVISADGSEPVPQPITRGRRRRYTHASLLARATAFKEQHSEKESASPAPPSSSPDTNNPDGQPATVAVEKMPLPAQA